MPVMAQHASSGSLLVSAQSAAVVMAEPLSIALPPPSAEVLLSVTWPVSILRGSGVTTASSLDADVVGTFVGSRWRLLVMTLATTTLLWVVTLAAAAAYRARVGAICTVRTCASGGSSSARHTTADMVVVPVTSEDDVEKDMLERQQTAGDTLQKGVLYVCSRTGICEE
jgi:hypothetical protein